MDWPEENVQGEKSCEIMSEVMSDLEEKRIRNGLHHLYQSESVASVAGHFFKANKKKNECFFHSIGK